MAIIVRPLILIFLTLLTTTAPAPAPAPDPPPSSDYNCLQQSCGGVRVSYPFGLSNRAGDCPPFSPFFNLTCDPSSNQLFLHHVMNTSSLDTILLPVTSITNTTLIVDISSLNASLPALSPSPINSSCSTPLLPSSGLLLPQSPGPFYISNDNEFGSFGCTYGILVTAKLLPVNMSSPAPSSSPLSSPLPSIALPPSPSPEQQIGSPAQAPAVVESSEGEESLNFTDIAVDGCAVMCPGDEVNPSYCGNGRVCCATALDENSASRFALYSVRQSPFADNISCHGGENYAILFHRSSSDLNRGIYQLKLMWALPSNLTHTLAQLRQSPDYACSSNSNLSIVEGVPGYLCSCNSGYEGDGYLKGSGCDDIDECLDETFDDCVSTSTCENSPAGSYTCRCKSWFLVGDGRKSGSGCQFSHILNHVLQIIAALVLLVLMMGAFFCLAIRWRAGIRKKYFMQHGGLELQEILRSRSGRETRVFTEKELKDATNNFADHMKVGAGGFGTVFKGILKDETVVAIKKANVRKGHVDIDREQFLNEMAILVRINHRHIVRLLGCCLETAVPLLVYELVSNGNLEQNLEGSDGTTAVMGWLQRLEVARQTAEALAYLHAAASPPILHRDVKSANVLLDDNFEAKVSDFGLSRLVVDGVEEVATALQGTIGYLDPEYNQTLEHTDKSDVYSLGVVLVELITGLKPVDTRNRELSFVSLALLFIHHMKEGNLDELIDARLTRTHDTLSSIMAVAALAHRCLDLQGSRRPSMSQVVDKLRYIVQSLKSSHKEDEDENAPLLSFMKEISGVDHEYAEAVSATMRPGSQSYGLHSGSFYESLVDAPTLPR